MKKTLTQSLTESRPKGSAPHLVVRARAGTGKTFTLIQGMKAIRGMDPAVVSNGMGPCYEVITPSAEQSRIWGAMTKDAGLVKTACFAAFDNTICDVLKSRVPHGCVAMTMHSMGYRAVRDHFPFSLPMIKTRMHSVIADVLGKDHYKLKTSRPVYIQAIHDMAKWAKLLLLPLDWTDDDERDFVFSTLREAADRQGVTLWEKGQDISTEVFQILPDVIARCRDVEKDRAVDFTDMIWLPAVLGLPVFRYDLLVVDEVQDLNACQHHLMMKAGERIVACGDDRQTIYQFAGAKQDGMDALHTDLSRTKRGVELLPLTVTRRCGHRIVEEANRYVPDLKAHPTNPVGEVRSLSIAPVAGDPANYRHHLRPDDLVLCRVNAPLFREALGLIITGVRVCLRGRDISPVLKRIVQESRYSSAQVDGETDLERLRRGLDAWLLTRTTEINATVGGERGRRARIEYVQDLHNCILAIMDYSSLGGVDTVLVTIDRLCGGESEDGCVVFSSIHKAKGTEARRVFLLEPDRYDARHDRRPEDVRAEENLQYVAITRAIEEFIRVA